MSNTKIIKPLSTPKNDFMEKLLDLSACLPVGQTG
jgi:hypothetical protein